MMLVDWAPVVPKFIAKPCICHIHKYAFLESFSLDINIYFIIKLMLMTPASCQIVLVANFIIESNREYCWSFHPRVLSPSVVSGIVYTEFLANLSGFVMVISALFLSEIETSSPVHTLLHCIIDPLAVYLSVSWLGWKCKSFIFYTVICCA